MTYSIVKAELYKAVILARRNYFKLFDITVFPIILFFAITMFLRFVEPSNEVMSMAITGLIGWRAVYHFQIETGFAYMEDYWSKNISQELAGPLKLRHMILSGAISGGVKFVIILSIYLTLAVSLFSFEIVDFSKFIIGVAYLGFTGFILGLITLGLIILHKHKAFSFAFMIPDFIVLLSGVYYPISVFPSAIVKFAHLLPTFYGFELLKSMVGYGTANYLGMIVVGFVWLIGAIVFLHFAIKKAKKNGSFANFN